MGRQVTVRFDPDNLHAPLAVYARDGRLICEAPAIEATGFADAEAAQAHSRAKRLWIKSHRALLEIEQRLGIEDVANLLPPPQIADAAPEPRVVRLAPSSRQPDNAAADASFSRAVRALAGDVIPFDPDERERGTG